MFLALNCWNFACLD